MSQRIKKIFYTLCGGGTLFGTLAVIRGYINGERYEGKEELFGKTVIITGSNRGIGKETAIDLSKRGARVIMACRDMKKCLEAREDIINQSYNKNVECMLCDLASLESIKNFADNINQNEKFLHIFVNNAGTMWNPKSFTKDGFETHLGVNHLGHFYLTNLLLPKLIFNSPSRIIVVTSRDYLKGKINFEDLNSAQKYDAEEAYNQSKLANILFVQELNEKLKGTGVTANCVDPGYVYSDLMRNASVYKSPYSPVSLFFKAFLKTPAMGAQSIIYSCVSPELENVTGKYIRDFRDVELASNATDKDTAKRLWATSEKWTRLK